MVVSFIDVGSNAVKLSVFDLKINKEIYSDRTVSRLGQNSFDNHILQEENINNTIEAIKQLYDKAKKYNSKYIEIVATSCVRDAKNKEYFAQKVINLTNISLKILSGEEEAEIIFKGVISSFKEKCKFLLVDIGGGSTEFILGDQNKIYYRESVNLGAVRLHDKFKSYKETCDYAEEKLIPVFEKIKTFDFDTIIGSSGTWLNLIRWTKNRKKIENYSSKDVLESIEILKEMNVDEIKKQEGINPDRADIILSGSAIVSIILKEFFQKRIYLTTSSLKEGLVNNFKQ